MMPDKYSILGHSVGFWIAVFLAVLLRFLAKPIRVANVRLRIFKSVVAIMFAVFSAYYFTEPVIVWRNLDPEVWTIPVAILLTLTGQNLIEFIVNVIGDFERMKALLEVWRGGGRR